MSFSCQFNVLPIFSGMARPSGHEWHLTVRITMLVSGSLYLVMGLLALLAHPDTTGNILVDFSSSTAGSVLGALLAIGLVATFPLFGWEGANSMDELLDEFCQNSGIPACASDGDGAVCNNNSNHIGDEGSPARRPSFRSTFCFSAAASAVAVSVSDLSKVLSLVGAMCAVPLMLVFPPLIFRNLVLPPFPPERQPLLAPAAQLQPPVARDQASEREVGGCGPRCLYSPKLAPAIAIFGTCLCALCVYSAVTSSAA
ncbi:unnamed protein product [Polarella glacialis]|uniref:Amino acid transporter transmembrane domain-containing protein n=1 Tax=Polarella glacialis TaxID=89957 RepID=A0A813H0S8_POLGL|nr:unnamed protein product [Polarella glacialis]